MKSSKIVCAIAIASLGIGSLSFAQNNDRRDARDGRDTRQAPQQMEPQPQRGGQEFRQQGRDDQHADSRRDQRFHNRSDNRYDNRFDRDFGNRLSHGDMRRDDRHSYYNARGPEFHRGGHMPQYLRSQQYVVTDYGTHRLSAPPRGHYWGQVGNDYVLFAIATGVIASIILNN